MEYEEFSMKEYEEYEGFLASLTQSKSPLIFLLLLGVDGILTAMACW